MKSLKVTAKIGEERKIREEEVRKKKAKVSGQGPIRGSVVAWPAESQSADSNEKGE